jgi:hypothetical protein
LSVSLCVFVRHTSTGTDVSPPRRNGQATPGTWSIQVVKLVFLAGCGSSCIWMLVYCKFHGVLPRSDALVMRAGLASIPQQPRYFELVPAC